jgi:hypothetical protein
MLGGWPMWGKMAQLPEKQSLSNALSLFEVRVIILIDSACMNY